MVIPNSVTSIGNSAFNKNKLPDNQAFIYKRTDTNSDGIAEINTARVISYGGVNKDIVIPNNVTTIENSAFYWNELTSVVITNSVTSIGDSAFGSNQLTSVVIPNSVTSIGRGAFATNTPYLSTITINKSCSDIKTNLKVGNNNYYPWLWTLSPYTASGVTIIGANNEVCDTYS
jgi:hypothetical protein